MLGTLFHSMSLFLSRTLIPQMSKLLSVHG